MNGTPRLRSAYPSTPSTSRKDEDYGGARPRPPNTLKSAMPPEDDVAPVIPLTAVDGPTQRFYLAAFYLALNGWRLYDYFKLISDDTESLWLFMKWVAIDGVFLYGMPALRIPWMEWSSSTMTVLFLLHSVLNAVLMFRIPIPLEAWIMAAAKTLYDRELSVSERRVKPSSLLHNSSLILGKQIIHILPEGSAMLNPEQLAFCIDHLHPSVEIPIRINQTMPMLIELLRVDLDTNANETISISSKEVKRLKKQADKEYGNTDTSLPRLLHYQVKQTGLYKLVRVVDESNLEVQRRTSDTLVVRCPAASVKAVEENKCINQLSDFYIQVDATPPLKVRYSKTINREDKGYSILTVSSDKLDTPLRGERTSGALVRLGEGDLDVSWARTQHFEIPINETLGVSGGWQYSIDEVHDACGNIVNYTRPESSGERKASTNTNLKQVFTVHERPRANFGSCSSQNPIRVARGEYATLPIQLFQAVTNRPIDGPHKLQYSFMPELDAVTEDGSAALERVETSEITLTRTDPRPRVSDPGVYTLLSVSSEFCTGEILESSSCFLLNPPDPQLSISSQSIPDKCAGNSVGLIVDFDLIGSPPFEVSYSITNQKTKQVITKIENISGLRSQLELRPTDAGQYVYEFLDITDKVHKIRKSLKGLKLRLEQDVKPPASAQFGASSLHQQACLDQEVEFEVRLKGEGPWTLEYEIVHNGRRTKKKLADIHMDTVKLSTGKLSHGGQTSMTLTSVADRTGCKVFLGQEAKVDVRHEKPRASFGLVEGKKSITILEGAKADLPVRLSGEGPWTLSYSEEMKGEKEIQKVLLTYENSRIRVASKGIYEILEVKDKSCPGIVESNGKTFEISWIDRPTLSPGKNAGSELSGEKITRRPMCEGDQDTVDIVLSGSPPFQLKYAIHINPAKGQAAVRTKKETLGLKTASIKMESAQAGHYKYQFTELADQQYNHDQKKFTPLTIEQQIYGRPSASFVNPGRTYSYCKEEAAGDEVIPISLVGTPPFALELGIKHHATVKPEIVNIPNIEKHRYDFHIPHNILALGSHIVTLRKVQDSNGCQRVTEFDGPTVRVNVNDIPTISPLEATMDYCVGDRISFALAGTPPFNLYYTFDGQSKKATSHTTTFRRIAERPGDFSISAISDKASTDACRAKVELTKRIHPMPSVQISRGRTAEIDIHEGGEAEVLFEFGGTPPFEFTYTRSTNAGKGKRSVILETKSDTSYEHSKTIKVSEEGTYEVVSIRDAHCSFSTQKNTQGKSGQQLLTFQ